MGYDPKQPRDEDGQWTEGGAGWKRLQSSKAVDDDKRSYQQKQKDDLISSWQKLRMEREAKGLYSDGPFVGEPKSKYPPEKYPGAVATRKSIAERIAEDHRKADRILSIDPSKGSDSYLALSKKEQVAADKRTEEFVKNVAFKKSIKRTIKNHFIIQDMKKPKK